MTAEKNFMVLGASGFVGRHVVDALKKSGFEVSAISRKDCDLRDVGQVKRLLASTPCRVIVNCAAHVGSLVYVTEQAATVVEDNMRLLLALYRATAEVSPETLIVNPVANCAFPAHLEKFTEGDLWSGPLHRSVMSYGSTRRMMMILSECFEMQHGVKSLSLFVPNMYGPYESTDPTKAHALSALVSKVVKAKRLGERKLEVWGTGIAIREWLYAPDFARIVAEVLGEDLALPAAFNVAQASGLSVRELVDILVEETGFSGEIIWDRSKPDGAPIKVMDDELFRRVFPAFKFTPIREGIASTASYYESVFPY
ncbi:MAG: NAD-dependent epimerase/dehydratase family protein [Myxococcales bacterium]|nr:NAD-dependent epimerase/dehydratase family protein [Myxococcales bacterium]